MKNDKNATLNLEKAAKNAKKAPFSLKSEELQNQSNALSNPKKTVEKNKYNYVIWDWNGTLYNDVEAGILTVNEMLSSRGLSVLDIERYKNIFGFPIINYYQQAGFDFKLEPYEILAAEFIGRNNAKLGESKLTKDAEFVLKEIKNRKINQIILSATRQDILAEQLAQFEIIHHFSDILGKKDFFAFGKEELAQQWQNSNNIDSRKILLVGDTIHDYEVANELACDCVLYSGGHQSKERLKNIGAKVIDSLKEVLELL